MRACCACQCRQPYQPTAAATAANSNHSNRPPARERFVVGQSEDRVVGAHEVVACAYRLEQRAGARRTGRQEVGQRRQSLGATGVGLTDALVFETYYQYEWKHTILNGVSSYFSQQDFLGPGAEAIGIVLHREVRR